MTEAASQKSHAVRFVSLERDERDCGAEDTYTVLDIQEYSLPSDPEARRTAIMKHMRRFRDEAHDFYLGETERTPRSTMIALGKALDESLKDMSEFHFDIAPGYRLNVYFLPTA